MTPKEFLISYVEKFNAGDINSLMDMYEIDASHKKEKSFNETS